MHPLTRRVLKHAQELELEQFRRPDERERIREWRVLALEQVADDQPDTGGERRDRVGGHDTRYGRVDGRVLHYADDGPDLGASLWMKWTPTQVALEAGMAVFTARLPQQQREVVAIRYGRNLSLGDTAKVLGISKGATQVHERRMVERLRAELTEAFLTSEEAA